MASQSLASYRLPPVPLSLVSTSASQLASSLIQELEADMRLITNEVVIGLGGEEERGGKGRKKNWYETHIRFYTY